MSNPDNEQLARRLYEVLNTGDAGLAAEIFAPNYVVHHPLMPGGSGGLRETLGMIAMFREMFRDLRYVVNEVIVLRDQVGVRWTATGIGPNDQRVTVNGIDMLRIEPGRIREAWVVSDADKLMPPGA